MTKQKKEILDFLKSVKTHPSAEEVYYNVREKIPKITLATVYRNLNQLTEQGKVLKLEVNGEFRFDGCTCSHQHCVCDNCGCISDNFNDKLGKKIIKEAKISNFNPRCVYVIFRGLCEKCQEV